MGKKPIGSPSDQDSSDFSRLFFNSERGILWCCVGSRDGTPSNARSSYGGRTRCPSIERGSCAAGHLLPSPKGWKPSSNTSSLPESGVNTSISSTSVWDKRKFWCRRSLHGHLAALVRNALLSAAGHREQDEVSTLLSVQKYSAMSSQPQCLCQTVLLTLNAFVVGEVAQKLRIAVCVTRLWHGIG